jgi:hypothetical protein
MNPRRYILSLARPTAIEQRPCRGCGKLFTVGYYKGKTREGEPCWRPYSKCPTCRRTVAARWYHRNSERSKRSSRAWKLANASKPPRYWYQYRPSFNLYRKMRLAGIPKDEARDAALQLWRREKTSINSPESI